ncbi:MAG: hypothetical protein ABI356_03405 [Steroidobacteraceae bacterium]
MKSVKLKFAGSVIALGLFLQPTVSWSSRAYNQVVTGTVTASPSSGTIEVDHHTYQVTPNSAAAKAMVSIYVGETVDMVMDGPPNGTSEVISIMQHPGS